MTYLLLFNVDSSFIIWFGHTFLSQTFPVFAWTSSYVAAFCLILLSILHLYFCTIYVRFSCLIHLLCRYFSVICRPRPAKCTHFTIIFLSNIIYLWIIFYFTPLYVNFHPLNFMFGLSLTPLCFLLDNRLEMNHICHFLFNI